MFTLTVSDFFIGKNSLFCRAPVDRHFCNICQSLIVKLQENPLCPLVVFRITCADFSIPVIGETKCLQLITEMIDIGIGKFSRMMTGFECELLCRQTESIKSHRMHDIEALHAFHSCHDIRCGIAFWMTYMKALSTWIREHIHDVVLRF